MIEITDRDADNKISESASPFLIKFTGEGCKACSMLDGPLAAIEANGEIQIVAADVAECGTLANRIGVRGLPTLALFSGGQLLDTRVGAASQSEIEAWLHGALA